MDRNMAKTKLDNGISIRLDFHENSYKAQYEIWVRRQRNTEEYSWKIEAKARTLAHAKTLYDSQVQALQTA